MNKRTEKAVEKTEKRFKKMGIINSHAAGMLLTILFWLIPLALSAQHTISGRITDAGDGSAISGASVFFSNTTVGTTTDDEGKYQLKIPGEGSYRLTVSHVGYQPVFRDIEYGGKPVALDIALQTHEMEEVTVAVKVDVRKKDIDLFWRTLLGEKPSKKTIQVLNPEAVYCYYNREAQKLTVSCRVPIQIVNHETGYHIQYMLSHFTHDYNLNLSSWEGQSLFTELEPENIRQKDRRDKNRKKVYRVSITNFIRSLYHDSLSENGFMFVKGDIHTQKYYPVDLEGFLTDDPSTSAKTFYIQPDDRTVMLVSFDKPVTDKNLQEVNGQKGMDMIGLFRNNLRTPGDSVRIFPDGTYSNPIYLSPLFSSKPLSGLDMFLPLEYHPDGLTAAFATEQAKEEQPAHPPADSLVRVARRFSRQLSVFPQEKIHLQTDKPYYLSGERIWFRAHVVDAATHVPSFSSGSVFVELLDARDSVASRIKTGIGNDLYSGYIDISEDAPEGDCIIRAYTAAMRDSDEDYFFMKTIRIGDPMSRIVQVHPEFQFLSDKRIGADFRFSHIRPAGPVTPESLKITINNDKPVSLKSADGKSGFSFNLSPNEKQRVMLLDAMYEKNPFRQYVRIPYPDDDFDVSFYPEGGSALYGVTGRIAFKAMQRDGTEIDVDGTVYDSRGNEITSFKTDVRGMGRFMMRQEPGETYHTICINSQGQSKRFELPAAKTEGYALSAAWGKEYLTVDVLQPESRKTDDTLCLIVHTRGLIQDVRIWENTSEPVVFPKYFFPSGVSHLLLLTKDMTPVSERLVFALNDDQAKVTSKTGRDRYYARSPVEYTVHITDETGEPLTGNFSVSVTDDHDVAADSASHILTSLLVTSDLRGNIPDPGYYFRKKGQSSVYGFDMLMLTQGWRRYDTERIVRNDLMYPDTIRSQGYDLSGTVRTVLGWKPVENAYVSILSLRGNFARDTYTDRNGRFFLPDGEAPDSIRLIVQTELPRADRLLNYELILDDASYPERTLPVVASGVPDREVFAMYADKAERQYVDEHGIRIRHIPEVIITAPRKNIVAYSFFYSPKDVSFSLTEEEIERIPPVSMASLLSRIPSLMTKIDYNNNMISVKENIYVDDLKEDSDYVMNRMNPSDIAQVDIVKVSFGRPGIYIHTKGGKIIPKETPYIKYFMPLGFQKPAEFYAPKYDTPAENQKPDLRTTIHWAPNITTDENGKASFSFYTADAPSTYTVVIEGITEDGKIVYKRDKIVVEN